MRQRRGPARLVERDVRVDPAVDRLAATQRVDRRSAGRAAGVREAVERQEAAAQVVAAADPRHVAQLVDLHVARVDAVGAQQVFALERAVGHRLGRRLEEVQRRRAVQAQVLALDRRGQPRRPVELEADHDLRAGRAHAVEADEAGFPSIGNAFLFSALLSELSGSLVELNAASEVIATLSASKLEFPWPVQIGI